MRADRLDEELCSGNVVRVRRALRFLQARSRGPHYPRARILRLLDEENPDSIRESALRFVLGRGQHPLEEPRIRELLENASEQLFRAATRMIGRTCFPSAAADTLSFCWEAHRRTAYRLAVLAALEPLGPEAAKRFLGTHQVLRSGEPPLVTAALGLLKRTYASGVDRVFGVALRHRDPRNRSTALEWLSQRFPGRDRLRYLRPYLRNRHHRIRSTAAVLCFPDLVDESVETLDRLSREQEPLSRAAAAWGLGSIGTRDPRVEGILERLAEDRDSRVSSRARQELARLWKETAA